MTLSPVLPALCAGAALNANHEPRSSSHNVHRAARYSVRHVGREREIREWFSVVGKTRERWYSVMLLRVTSLHTSQRMLHKAALREMNEIRVRSCYACQCRTRHALWRRR